MKYMYLPDLTMAAPQRNPGSSNSGGGGGNRIRVSLSLTCLLATLFSISLIGLAFQFLAVHRISSKNDHNMMSDIDNMHTNNAAGSLIRGAPDELKLSTNTKKQSTITIAYTVTITGCSEKFSSAAEATSLITQGAAVLQHSIHLAHTTSSKYDYQMYAFVHPTATSCSVAPLKKLGYQVLIRNTPFETSAIHTKFLRENISKASCCGEKEFLKLYAYTLSEPIAVILDLDSLVLRPMDEMFDVMLMMKEEGAYHEEYHQEYHQDRDDETENGLKKMYDQLPIHHQQQQHSTSGGGGGNNNNNMVDNKLKQIDAFYTKDYNMINPGGEKYAGVQGGFLMLRPDEDVFAEYIHLVLQGNYIEGRGWGGKYGYFYGGAQVQGICSYYFGELHPDRGVELNRCRVNQMVDAPRFDVNMKEERYRNARGKCRDGRDECEDCRETDLKDIWSVHFTLCGKPWHCAAGGSGNNKSLCSKLHSEWFRIRRSFEESRSDDNNNDGNEMRLLPKLEGSYRPEIYHGYCKGNGGRNYLPVTI